MASILQQPITLSMYIWACECCTEIDLKKNKIKIIRTYPDLRPALTCSLLQTKQSAILWGAKSVCVSGNLNFHITKTKTKICFVFLG